MYLKNFTKSWRERRGEGGNSVAVDRDYEWNYSQTWNIISTQSVLSYTFYYHTVLHFTQLEVQSCLAFWSVVQLSEQWLRLDSVIVITDCKVWWRLFKVHKDNISVYNWRHSGLRQFSGCCSSLCLTIVTSRHMLVPKINQKRKYDIYFTNKYQPPTFFSQHCLLSLFHTSFPFKTTRLGRYDWS